MKVREGDLIETRDGNIFDVKGYVHPPGKIIAFIRFTPDPNGARIRGSTRYSKVYPLQERYELLRERFPQYLVFNTVFDQRLCEVRIGMVQEHYQPSKYLQQLRRTSAKHELQKQTLDLAQLLHNKARVKWSALGVSGSLLVGLHTAKSDIDLVAYGSQNCRKIYDALRLLIHDGTSGVKPYDKESLKALFDFRSKDTIMKFEDFIRTESRKVLQGMFRGRDYFIRCIKDWTEVSETYGSVQYKSMGRAKISATVIDDSQMIFTPCTYRIADVDILQGKVPKPLREVSSFRGRFCEQASKGERIIAYGTVEKVEVRGGRKYFRLLLGNRPSDFMIPLQ